VTPDFPSFEGKPMFPPGTRAGGGRWRTLSSIQHPEKNPYAENSFAGRGHNHVRSHHNCAGRAVARPLPDQVHHRWSFGVTPPSVTSTGGGGASGGKAALSDLSVTRRADSCTPFLFAAAVSGKGYKSVTIVQQDTQKDDIFTVTLQDVVISSYQLGGDQSGEVPPSRSGLTSTKSALPIP
jgi:Type VI secretion system effector, Hcp